MKEYKSFFLPSVRSFADIFGGLPNENVLLLPFVGEPYIALFPFSLCHTSWWWQNRRREKNLMYCYYCCVSCLGYLQYILFYYVLYFFMTFIKCDLLTRSDFLVASSFFPWLLWVFYLFFRVHIFYDWLNAEEPK